MKRSKLNGLNSGVAPFLLLKERAICDSIEKNIKQESGVYNALRIFEIPGNIPDDIKGV